MSSPPELGFLGRVLGALLPEDHADAQLGDLAEGYLARRAHRGDGPARAWLRRQTLRSLWPALRFRVRTHLHSSREGAQPMETVLQDLKYGVRSLFKNRMFATVSVTTLALAIGVNTAIFSIVGVVIFSELPMRDHETVMMFRSSNPQTGVDNGSLSYPEYLDFQEQTESFESLAAATSGRWILTLDEVPQRVDGYRITANLLDAWRLKTVVGRNFLEEEALPGGPAVAILSSGFWKRQFASDPGVVGQTLRLDGREYEVVGVLEERMEFANLAQAEVWLPLQEGETQVRRDDREYMVTGRLKDGFTPERAEAEVASISPRLAEQFVENRGWSIRALPVRESLLGDEDRTLMILLGLTVGFVLMIACANVANMLLARATARAREMAVRAALGAARIRLIRQLLTESFVIAATASLLGLVLAKGLLRYLVYVARGADIMTMATIDRPVLIFTMLVSVAAPLAFGLVPALRASATSFASAIREGSSGAGGARSGARLRSTLAGGQIALALMLMVVAGLAVRSMVALNTADMGFADEGVVSMRLDLPAADYGDDASRLLYFDETLRRLGELTGARGVALASARPVFEPVANRLFDIEGQPVTSEQVKPTAFAPVVSPGYFDLLQIPVVGGRAFGDQDTPTSTPTVMVSAEAAERYWGGRDPVGSRIRLLGDESEPWRTVVGVAADVQSVQEFGEADPLLYLPHRQNPQTGFVAMVGLAGDPAQRFDEVRAAVWAGDGNVPIDDLKTLEQWTADDNATGAALISLFIVFAIFALMMAGVGIYGVMSYSVSQRVNEIGIRMALGAQGPSVRRMVLAQGIRILVLGSAFGLMGALLLGGMLESLVFGISPRDPTTFAGVAVVLGLIALIANLIPAVRATRVQPMQVLRAE